MPKNLKIIAVVALFLLSLATLIFVLLYTYKEAISVTKDEFHKQQTFLAQQTAVGLQANTKSLLRELKTLSTKTTNSTSTEEIRIHFEKTYAFVKNFFVNDVAMLDRDGIVRIALNAPHLEEKDFSFRHYFKEAQLLTEQVPTHELITFRGQDAGEKGLVFAMPLFDKSSTFNGVVLFTIKVDSLIKGLIPQGFIKGSESWVINPSGEILHHPTYKPGSLIDQDTTPNPSFTRYINKIKQGATYAGEFIDSNGVSRVACSFPVKVADQQWIIVFTTPEEIVRHALTKVTRFYILIFLTIFILVASGTGLVIYWNYRLQKEIANRNAIDQLLREKQESLNLAQKIAHIGNWDWNIFNNKVWWSDETYRICGLFPADFGATYEAIIETVHPEDQEFVKKSIDDALFKNEPYNIDHRILTPEGIERTVHQGGEVTYDQQGKPIRMVGTIQDISKLKKLEQDYLNSKKLEATATLAGGIAHDFNNLLGAIIGNLDMAREDAAPKSSLHRDIQAAYTASLQAKELTRKFITFSSGGSLINRALDVEKLLSESISLVMSGSNATYDLDICNDIQQIIGDFGQLQHVFTNVIKNSIEAMPDGGNIKVRVLNFTQKESKPSPSLKSGNYVKISIQDQGNGIADHVLPNIFDPYFSTKDRGVQKGMGLGLTTAYSIVQKHNGVMLGESSPENGTIITVFLPAVKGSHKQSSEDNITSTLKVKKQSARILYMDDEELLRIVTQKMLTRLGHIAVTAKHGQEAIEKYKEAIDSGTPFDAVLLDLTVKGGMGGEKTLESLKNINGQIIALACSGYTSDPIMSNFTSYGFKGALAKPFKKEELAALFNQVL